MKLLCEFEIRDMGEAYLAVPVGDDAYKFRCVLRLNADAAQMLQLIQESNTPEETLDKLCAVHPDENRDTLAEALRDFLNQLIQEYILQP